MHKVPFICPVCGKDLCDKEKSLVCENDHCFDRSRKGTVNLLLSNSARHGDDSLMVRSRSAFLDKGYYRPLLRTVGEHILEAVGDKATLLDCGCGECWYTSGLFEMLTKAGKEFDIIGIDVSKQALSAGASRNRALRLAAASVYKLPVPDRSIDIVLSLFAPFAGSEYLRVLRDGGFYITAFPLEDHLYELKQAVYDKPYRNSVSGTDIEGFDMIRRDNVDHIMELQSNEDIIALFSMTPYCYKTSAQDRKKLDALAHLATRAQFAVITYKKL